MSRNFGLGTRDMSQAGRAALTRVMARGELSYASVDTVGDRWSKFVQYAKQRGVGRMERVGFDLVVAYGRHLAMLSATDEMSVAYAQNLVSAVNTVMGLVCSWKTVSPTIDCGIGQRSFVRQEPPAYICLEDFQRLLDALNEQGLTRQMILTQLVRHFGLRSKEASLINAHVALRQAQSAQKITISYGTKGGRARTVPVLGMEPLEALRDAAMLQDDDSSLVPGKQTWAQWRDGGLRDGREVLKAYGLTGFHELRAAYACARYHHITGSYPPVCGAVIVDRDGDERARRVISEELGHDRLDVVSAYIGGR